MGNHHALRVIVPTIRDHFGVNLTGKGLRFFRGWAAEKEAPTPASMTHTLHSYQHVCMNEALSA